MRPITEHWEKFRAALPQDLTQVPVEALEYVFFAGAAALFVESKQSGWDEADKLIRRMLERELDGYRPKEVA